MLLSNYNVYTKASTTFALLVPVLFAFASRYFLCSFFAFIVVISYIYYNLNFLICLLLQVEDYIKVGAVKVDIVVGTWIEGG